MSNAPALAQLSRAALRDLPRASRPLLDPAELQPRTVHIGFGAFHRAHQAVITELAAARSGEAAGTVVVVPRSAATADALDAQDGLFSVAELGATDAAPLRVVASTAGVVRGWVPFERDGLLLDPTISVVTLTITEQGYRRARSGGLDVHDPAVADDLAGGEPTAVGLLVRALAARSRGCAAPLAVVSCDNLARNGEVTARVVREYVEHTDWHDREAVLTWLAESVTFPSTVVDQIVPATTPRVLEAAATALGSEDQLAVAGEPYRQWVLQDAFPAGRPAWVLGGAEFVDDVAPHQLMKLRLLNGSHSALAYLGLATGCRTVRDTMDTPWGPELVSRLCTEVGATLPTPTGAAEEYGHQLIERFSNPGIHHQLVQIGGDGAAKVAERWFDALRELRAAGRPTPVLETALAGWANATRPGPDGQLFATKDPLARRLATCWNSGSRDSDVVAALLDTAGAEDLAEDGDLIHAVASRLPAVRAGLIDV